MPFSRPIRTHPRTTVTPTTRGTQRPRHHLAVAGALTAAAVVLAATPAEAATVASAIVGTPSGRIVGLGAGTYAFSDFGANNIGLDLAGKGGLNGAGTSSSIVRMNAGSSTKGGIVPTGRGSSNPLYLMSATGSVRLSNFWLQGTSQGHLYNGLKVSRGAGATVTNVRVTAIPGSGYVPPQETATLNDQHGSGDTWSNISEDGQGLGAIGIAANSSSNITVANSSFVNNAYSAGAAFWQTRNITLRSVVSRNNRTGLNFERCSGSIVVMSPTILNHSNQDLYIGSDQGSASITITNPVYSGHLRIRVPAVYRGVANKQRRNDIHVVVDGVDRTSSVVTWI